MEPRQEQKPEPKRDRFRIEQLEERIAPTNGNPGNNNPGHNNTTNPSNEKPN
jgi:hypothetical protein